MIEGVKLLAGNAGVPPSWPANLVVLYFNWLCDVRQLA